MERRQQPAPRKPSHENRSVDEVADLLVPYPAEVAGYWHDVGHAEVLDRLGLVDRHRWLELNGARTIGSHLHDVNGIVDHRAPGEGDVAWQYTPEDLLGPGLRLLREQGVVPA